MTDPRTPAVVVGLDLSLTGTGIAHADGTTETFGTDKRDDDIVRMDAIARHVQRVTDLPDLELVVIEGLAFDAHDNKRVQAQLAGIVRHTLYQLDRPYLLVPPATLKRYATGTGNAKKMQVFAAATHRLGYRGDSLDEADALWLRALGWHLIMGEPIIEDLPKVNQTAVKPLVRQRPDHR